MGTVSAQVIAEGIGVAPPPPLPGTAKTVEKVSLFPSQKKKPEGAVSGFQ